MAKGIDSRVIEGLKKALSEQRTAFTVQDASTKAGLSLMDTKAGLNYLLAEYRGHLHATSEGELLYSFPTSFTKPWEASEKFQQTFNKVKKAGLGILKFVVRAWISIVMVAYVVIFALIILALTFSRNNDREEGSSLSSTLMMHTLIRLVLDSLFWTFHPFSPFRIGHDNFYDHYPPRVKKVPFYERVNRFFFGPEEQAFDEQEARKIVLQEIRAQKGRIGLLDVMRLTGLSKTEADPFMAKLMLDHEGDVLVSEEGGIYYEFLEMRKSANQGTLVNTATPIWQHRIPVPPFTGNTFGSNVLIASLNGFNMLMSMVAIANGWTIEKFQYFLTLAQNKVPLELVPQAPEGTPLLLGWVPFIFSTTLFLIPLFRAFGRPKKIKEINNKNGKRGLLKAILTRFSSKGIKEEILREHWADQARAQVDEKEFVREIIRLGGEINTDAIAPAYRFTAIENEMKALEGARKQASYKESSVGEVIFSSQK